MLIASLSLNDLAATERLGLFLADRLGGGDVLALNGPLGAGKSAMARAMIQHLCPEGTDIPSPTFTLVQTYEPLDRAAIWHFDLYRLAAPEDAFALGIEEAFVEAICLIEWPDRLDGYLPATVLTLELTPIAGADTARQVTISGNEDWLQRLDGVARL